MLGKNRTRVAMMVAVLAAFGGLASARTAQGKLIDGNLADWGVTPFTDWAPDSPALYVEDDYRNDHFPYGGERFDAEAMYMVREAGRLCVGIITSFPEAGLPDPNHPSIWIQAGDLLLDLDPGDGFDWEYAVILNGLDKGDLYYQPALVLAQSSSGFPANGPSNVDVAGSDPPIGSVDVAWHNYGDLEGWGSDTYGIEIGIDLAYLASPTVLDLAAHHTMGCGNDALDLSGLVVAPEPVTLGLLLTGGLLAGAGRLARRRIGRTR